MSDLISRSALLRHKTYLFDEVLGYEACVCVDDIVSAPAVDAVPVDKMELQQFSINTQTRTAKAVFRFGDKRITLCRDCGELAPVVHGRWGAIFEKLWNVEFEVVTGFECSNCGHLEGFELNYCPNCGAKMDGEADV